MSWNGNFDDGNDFGDGNDVDAGVIVAISAGVIVFFGIVVAVIEKTSPDNRCFRFLDRSLCWIPFAAFFVMVAIVMITATSAEPGSNLPVGVGASCFLAWAALIAFVVWRAKKRTLANIRAGRNPLDDGTGDSSIVFAIPIDCDASNNDNDGACDGNIIDMYANEIHHPGNYTFYSTMTSGGGGYDGGGGGYDGGGGGYDGGGGGYDGGGGSSGGSGDTGGATTSSSSTGDSGGGGC